MHLLSFFMPSITPLLINLPNHLLALLPREKAKVLTKFHIGTNAWKRPRKMDAKLSFIFVWTLYRIVTLLIHRNNLECL